MNINNRQVFGAFLKSKRIAVEIPIRLMAEKVGIKPGYYNDIESGRRTSIELELLGKIVDELRLTEDDRETFYDLAGNARSAAPPDLTGYINKNKQARVALRVAKEKASEDDWKRFNYMFKKENIGK